MKILGQVKSSFIDYPGHASTVIFIGGCNFACDYCHNPAIVKNIGEEISQNDFFAFLEKRKRFLDGVCVTGGEPTLHNEVYDLVKAIKNVGYKVKLDTNGTNPNMIDRLIKEELVDYIAMDIKGPFSKYESITNRDINLDNISKSIELLMNSNIEYEFRTTVHKEILAKKDIKEIAENIKGSNKYSIQNFKMTKSVLNKNKNYTSFEEHELDDMRDEISDLINKISIKK